MYITHTAFLHKQQTSLPRVLVTPLEWVRSKAKRTKGKKGKKGKKEKGGKKNLKKLSN